MISTPMMIVVMWLQCYYSLLLDEDSQGEEVLSTIDVPVLADV